MNQVNDGSTMDNSIRSQNYNSNASIQKLPARLRSTNMEFENNKNGFATFLNDKGELPRLSILDNYKQIMRIMNNSYIKGGEY